MSNTLSWGILGTGNIAKTFARGLASSKTGKLVAVGSRSREKAEQFAEEFKVPRAHATYEDVVADAAVQAVYIATPHPEHAQWAIRWAEAGKHILCEKPIGLNFAEAMAIVEAARLHDVFLMEAFMYRCHPQTHRLVQLIREKAIGDVLLIQATFSFQSTFNPESRVWSNGLGGGGILDVGCYPVSLARLVAGAVLGLPFAEPTQVSGAARLLPITGVDEYAVATLQFDSGIIAQVATGITLEQENVARIYGTQGHIVIPNPWAPARDGGVAKILVHKNGEAEPSEMVLDTPEPLYAIEADTVAANLANRQAVSPAMSWDDTLGNMAALDRWRQAVGLTYESEKPGNVPTVHRRPLAVSPKHTMKYGRIAGVGGLVSRLVMGVDNLTFAPMCAVLWDDFFERGGNCFDTAFVYGGGAHERALGAWVQSRKLRSRVVILDKGAHTPDCNPAAVTQQHQISLDRLRMTYVDIYMLHRDNPAVPVGEFIDVLNGHVQAGTIKAFGASNWSIARIEEANAWAMKNGKVGFAAASNNFSLARMVEAPWPGCLAASDPASRAWFARTQMPLMPWSSQARGFFVHGRADAAKTGDEELMRCWYSPDNFQRLQRATELAQKKGVLPINIALAYVLCQPFPTFPLIGPRLLSETRSSLRALEVELTEDDVKWLNLET